MKSTSLIRKKFRVRNKIKRVAKIDRYRLSVSRSAKNISAALITAMPIVTLLCIFWMYYEGIEKKEISEYVSSTLKFLIPTIPMFVLFPILIEKTNFYITVFLCCLSIMLLIYLLNFYFNFFRN